MKKLLLSLMVVFSTTTFAQTAITQISVSLQAVGSIANVFVSPGVTSVNLGGFGNVTGEAGGLGKIISISTDSLDSNCRSLITSFASHVILHRKLTPTIGVPLLKISGSVTAGSTRLDYAGGNSIAFILKPASRLSCEVSYGSFNCSTGLCQPN